MSYINPIEILDIFPQFDFLLFVYGCPRSTSWSISGQARASISQRLILRARYGPPTQQRVYLARRQILVATLNET